MIYTSAIGRGLLFSNIYEKGPIMKTAVLGYSGAGKSTLAKQLAVHAGSPVLYLDTVQWLPGWQERNVKEGVALVQNFLDTHDSWVIDGNYQKYCFARRLEEADEILLLLLPRLFCFVSAWRRFLKSPHMSRESMTEGCPEKFDLEFIRWLLWEGRARKQRCVFLEIAKQYPNKTRIFYSRRAVNAYLQSKGIQI